MEIRICNLSKSLLKSSSKVSTADPLIVPSVMGGQFLFDVLFQVFAAVSHVCAWPHVLFGFYYFDILYLFAEGAVCPSGMSGDLAPEGPTFNSSSEHVSHVILDSRWNFECSYSLQ